MKVEFEMNLKNVDWGRRKSRGKIKGRGKLIKEYEYYYLIDNGKYRTCIGKADIICGQAKIKFLEGNKK